jgi:Uma2 family endonuclease
MAGASRNHNRLVRRIERLLNDQFGNGPCEAWNSDIKLRIRASLSEFFYYPDVMVGCDPADNDHYYLESPSILFEVLSPLTEQINRREENSWVVSLLIEPADRLEFPGQTAGFTLEEIYETIEFESP